MSELMVGTDYVAVGAVINDCGSRVPVVTTDFEELYYDNEQYDVMYMCGFDSVQPKQINGDYSSLVAELDTMNAREGVVGIIVCEQGKIYITDVTLWEAYFVDSNGERSEFSDFIITETAEGLDSDDKAMIVNFSQ